MEAERAASPPEATVERGGDATHALRAARGFSSRELSEAGMSLLEARMHGLRVDVRRRSRRQENVVALRGWVKRTREATKPPKPERKKRRAPVKKRAGEGAASEKPPRKKRRRTRAKQRKKERSTAG